MDISLAEARRYLRAAASPEIDAGLLRAEKALNRVLTPRYTAAEFALELDPPEISGTLLHTRSADLCRCLAGCRRAFAMIATLGPGVDLLLRRTFALSQAEGLYMQAAAGALTETWCDQVELKLLAGLPAGCRLRPRFSPGYGDLELAAVQPQLFRALRAPETIGVTLTAGMLMVPGKSVSAIIGIVEPEQGQA